MYKCVHGLNLPYLNELFVRKNTRYNLRDNNRLQQPEFQTIRYGFKSFLYYGSKLWNFLPSEVKNSEIRLDNGLSLIHGQATNYGLLLIVQQEQIRVKCKYT